MKKFRFALDTVLDYRQQALDALKIEHGKILAEVRQQEEVLAAVEGRYAATNEEFCEKKCVGLTVAGAMIYETGLRALEHEIAREMDTLAQLRRKEAAKHAQLVEAKQDATSLEKLREKKLGAYNKGVLKSEEQFIDELVSATRISGSAEAQMAL